MEAATQDRQAIEKKPCEHRVIYRVTSYKGGEVDQDWYECYDCQAPVEVKVI